MRLKNIAHFFAAAIWGCLMTGAAAHAQTIADPNLYIGEYANEDVFSVTPTGTGKTTFISPFGTGHRFSGMAFDTAGNLFITTGGGTQGQGNEVRKFSSTGTFLGNFVTGLNLPTDITIDTAGSIYIAYSSKVNKYTADGTLLYTLTAGLSTPDGLATDSQGNLFVSNGTTTTVRKFSSTGADLGIFASNIGSSQGIAIDPFDNVFVSSRSQNSVLKFDSVGTLLTTYTGFNDPLSVASDASGNIYVANYANNTAGAGSITKISSTGQNLGAITTGLTGTYGLAFRVAPTVTPTAPEPGSLPLLAGACLAGMPLLGVVRARRRKNHGKQGEARS